MPYGLAVLNVCVAHHLVPTAVLRDRVIGSEGLQDVPVELLGRDRADSRKLLSVAAAGAGGGRWRSASSLISRSDAEEARSNEVLSLRVVGRGTFVARDDGRK
jgi:hypothetical protein